MTSGLREKTLLLLSSSLSLSTIGSKSTVRAPFGEQGSAELRLRTSARASGTSMCIMRLMDASDTFRACSFIFVDTKLSAKAQVMWPYLAIWRLLRCCGRLLL
jgi:hypothetical protein